MRCSGSSESVSRRGVRFYQCSQIFVLILLTNSECSPTNRIAETSAPPIFDDVHTYLSKYGYLPQSDFESGNLRTDDQLKEAIRTLQQFGNIPVTGIVDEKTKNLLKSPRCGMPDVQSSPYSRRKKRYTLHGQKWPSTSLTWSLQSKNLRNLEQGEVRREIYRALNVWTKHSTVTFREVNSDKADIVLDFKAGNHGDGYPFDGRGQVLAHAFFPGTDRGGDVHFDEQEFWVLDDDETSAKGTSLFGVAAHELGHSLGLSHSSVSSALMYPWYQGIKQNFELPEDDREAIQRLYGRKDTNRVDRYPVHYPEKPSYDPSRKYPPPTERPKYYPPPPKHIPISPVSPARPPIHRTTGFDEKPDNCDMSYDAIAMIRKELFIFKDKYVWRLGDKGLLAGYPSLIKNMWNKIPQNFTHIDAAYERYDKKIVFFIGPQMYLFDAHTLMSGYPKPLTTLGFPPSLDRIDAVMVWGHNRKTYFFRGNLYWRFDDETGRVELDYPRDMAIWKGVDPNIDAAFQWKDGATYFFKGKGYWKFDDYRMQVTNREQSLSAPFWMGCPKALTNGRDPAGQNTVGITNDSIFSQISNTIFVYAAVIIVLILILSVITIIVKKNRRTHSYLRPKKFGR